MLPSHLKGDCCNCIALCCVAYSFSIEQGFGFDKPANRRCKMLDTQHRCSIYDRRERSGFGGCVAYDCYGAGQRVTSDLKRQASIGALPVVTPHVLHSFRIAFAIHELLAIITVGLPRVRNSKPIHELSELKRSLEALTLDSISADVPARISQDKQRVIALLRAASSEQSANPSGKHSSTIS